MSGEGMLWGGGVGPSGGVEGGSLEGRLARLKSTEEELTKAVNAAVSYLAEVSKDRVPGPKSLEPLRSQFSDSVKRVEGELRDQIGLLSQVAVGTSHEGSVYSACHTKAAAAQRIENVEELLARIPEPSPNSL